MASYLGSYSRFIFMRESSTIATVLKYVATSGKKNAERLAIEG